MYIEELTESESGIGEEESSADVRITEVAFLNAKKALIVVGGRILFYPTLLYNVLRNKIESEFRWWDLIDEFLLLGAVPFPTDVPRLKQLGVEGVITLNEPYETLVPTSLYLVRVLHFVTCSVICFLGQFSPAYIIREWLCGSLNFIVLIP